jgi:hypothetical protein
MAPAMRLSYPCVAALAAMTLACSSEAIVSSPVGTGGSAGAGGSVLEGGGGSAPLPSCDGGLVVTDEPRDVALPDGFQSNWPQLIGTSSQGTVVFVDTLFSTVSGQALGAASFDGWGAWPPFGSALASATVGPTTNEMYLYATASQAIDGSALALYGIKDSWVAGPLRFGSIDEEGLVVDDAAEAVLVGRSGEDYLLGYNEMEELGGGEVAYRFYTAPVLGGSELGARTLHGCTLEQVSSPHWAPISAVSLEQTDGSRLVAYNTQEGGCPPDGNPTSAGSTIAIARWQGGSSSVQTLTTLGAPLVTHLLPRGNGAWLIAGHVDDFKGVVTFVARLDARGMPIDGVVLGPESWDYDVEPRYLPPLFGTLGGALVSVRTRIDGLALRMHDAEGLPGEVLFMPAGPQVNPTALLTSPDSTAALLAWREGGTADRPEVRSHIVRLGCAP